jgi:hypothetical protein
MTAVHKILHARILTDDHQVVEPESDEALFTWMATHDFNINVGRTTIGNLTITTDFMCVPFGIRTRPEHFETAIFEDGDCTIRSRYFTWDEAVRGHQEEVRRTEML